MTSQSNTRLTIIVEGIGHVIQNYYAVALKDQWENYKDKLSVIFVDESKYWKDSGDAENIQKCEKFIEHLKGWAEYIDKSTDKGAELYSDLSTNVVFIATPDSTHVKLALNWLSGENKCESIFIEKPLDSSLSRARVLQFYSAKYNSEIFPLDHYLVRSISFLDEETFARIMSLMGGSIEQISFYLLEDRSQPNIGPIENDKRTNAVKKGLVLDMFPHILALIHHFGFVETIEIDNLRVAQYTYENKEGKVIKTSIPRETFAHIEFSFKDYSEEGKIIKTNAFIGKGIAGSRDLEITGDVKRLELFGKNGWKCIIDLRNTTRGGTGQVEIVDDSDNSTLDECKLLDEPYTVLIQKVVEKYQNNQRLDWQFYLPMKTAKDCLTCIHEILSLIENFGKTKTKIPKYHIKTVFNAEDKTTISQAPYLEDVIAKLEAKEVKDIITIDKLIKLYKNEKLSTK